MKRKFLGGDDILQIKRGKCEAYNKNNKGMHNIDVSGQLIHSQATS
jgi:hypothetical protein